MLSEHLFAGILNLRQDGKGEPATMEASLLQRIPSEEKEKVKKLMKRASTAWWLPGHPGWAIWPIDTQNFMQNIPAPVSAFTPSSNLPLPLPSLPHRPLVHKESCKPFLCTYTEGSILNSGPERLSKYA